MNKQTAKQPSDRAAQLLDAIGQVRERYIVEAQTWSPGRARNPDVTDTAAAESRCRPRLSWRRGLVTAAAASLVLLLGSWFGLYRAGLWPAGLAGTQTTSSTGSAGTATAADRAAQAATGQESSQSSQIPASAAGEASQTAAASDSSPQGTAGLPLLVIGLSDDGSGATAAYGQLYLEQSELADHNPWTEDADITTLPVYRNLRTIMPDTQSISGTGGSDLLQQLEQLAAALQLTVNWDDLEAPVVYPSSEVLHSRESLLASSQQFDSLQTSIDGIQLSVSGIGAYTLNFDPDSGLLLPDSLVFPQGAEAQADTLPANLLSTTPEQMLALADYVLTQYSQVIQMDQPVIELHTRYGYVAPEADGSNGLISKSYQLSIYDKSGTLAEQMLNYAGRQLSFMVTELDSSDQNPSGGAYISLLRQTNQLDQLEKLGDYPIISLSEAESLLQAGQFAVSQGPQPTPDLDKLLKVEMVYQINSWDYDTILPWYIFYIDTSDQAPDIGLHSYIAYYVPAVDPQYISDQSVWQGGIN
ncbi:MAG: hypothetical protein PHR21_07335 [Oscillospiraceae bacterium]|nr:hypothetical protein [Oscillospiraceae bacterium]MDD4367874.1 hypothetical protein [Oscillospiraceae bacterium]